MLHFTYNIFHVYSNYEKVNIKINIHNELLLYIFLWILFCYTSYTPIPIDAWVSIYLLYMYMQIFQYRYLLYLNMPSEFYVIYI